MILGALEVTASRKSETD
jgi:hypothetical protein